MKITPEMFGLTKKEVAEFEKQDERLAKLRGELSKIRDNAAGYAAAPRNNLCDRLSSIRHFAVDCIELVDELRSSSK